MRVKSTLASIVPALVMLALSLVGCESNPKGESAAPAAKEAPAQVSELNVVAAASLGHVLAEFEKNFEQSHPGLDVRVRTGGSTALARQVLDLGSKADVLLLADEKLFSELLEPAWCKAHVKFASERVVIAYTEGSVAADEINAENWHEVLLRDDVKVGMADPDKAPVGYRTRMLLQLAALDLPGSDLEAKVLAKVGTAGMRADVAELLAPLQAGAMDYAFVYGTTAATAGLRILELPEKINLSSPDYAEHYAKASVTVAGRNPGETITRKGKPIVYGASLNGQTPARELAGEFLALLLSEQGSRMLSTEGFQVRAVEGDLSAAGLLERLSK